MEAHFHLSYSSKLFAFFKKYGFLIVKLKNAYDYIIVKNHNYVQIKQSSIFVLYFEFRFLSLFFLFAKFF